MSVAAPEAPTNTDGSSLEEDPPDSPPETARYRNLYIVLLVCGFILSSSFRRGNLQHRRAHRSRAAFHFTLFPGHWTDRLDRSRLSLIWLPWSSGSSACIPVASAIVLLGIQCIIAATGITIHALGRRPLGAQIGFFTACLPISVCHFPPGTSKWNKIEHRLFSFISSNWRGEPPRDYETVVHLIAKTTTAKGLQVTCRLDRRKYPTGRKVSKEEMKGIHLQPHRFHGEWNYVIRPHQSRDRQRMEIG